LYIFIYKILVFPNGKNYFLKEDRALIVALALLIRLVEPYLFANTFLYQATINTFLTAPQAIIHVPSEAG
jgi:hypothetical protein